MGLSFGVNLLLPWYNKMKLILILNIYLKIFFNLRSMLPDVIDEFALVNGERNESIFYSFFEFFSKLSGALATAITSLILEY